MTTLWEQACAHAEAQMPRMAESLRAHLAGVAELHNRASCSHEELPLTGMLYADGSQPGEPPGIYWALLTETLRAGFCFPLLPQGMIDLLTTCRLNLAWINAAMEAPELWRARERFLDAAENDYMKLKARIEAEVFPLLSGAQREIIQNHYFFTGPKTTLEIL